MKQVTVDVKKAINYPKGTEIIEMLQNMNSDKLDVKVFIVENQNSNKYEVFVDEVLKENAIGFIPSTQKDYDKFSSMMEDVDADRAELKAIELYGCFPDDNIILCRVKTNPIKKEAEDISTDQFEEVITQKAKEGIRDEESARKAIQVMKNNRVPDILIMKVIESWKAHDGVREPVTFYVDPFPNATGATVFTKCLFNALTHIPTIYEGDKSVGKNVCAETVAYVLNKPYYCFTMNKRLTQEDLYGSKQTDNSAQEALSKEQAKDYLKASIGSDLSEDELEAAAEYAVTRDKAASVSIIQELSVIIKALKEGCGVLCLNELNLGEANLLASFLNPLTDGTGFIVASGVGRVDVNDDIVIIGTQNADYTGVCDQNEATMSRFACIQFEYPDSIRAQLEAAVGADRLHAKYFKQVDQYYGLLKDAVHAGQIENTCLNIRGFVRALDAIAQIPDVTTLAEQIEMQVINTCIEDDRPTLLGELRNVVTL